MPDEKETDKTSNQEEQEAEEAEQDTLLFERFPDGTARYG